MTIKQRWENFKKVIPKEASPQQFEAMEEAFWSGAIVMLMELNKVTELNEHVAIQQISNYEKECLSYFESLRRKEQNVQGTKNSNSKRYN